MNNCPERDSKELHRLLDSVRVWFNQAQEIDFCIQESEEEQKGLHTYMKYLLGQKKDIVQPIFC